MVAAPERRHLLTRREGLPHQLGLSVQMPGSSARRHRGGRWPSSGPLLVHRRQVPLQPVEARVPRLLLLDDPTAELPHALDVQPCTVAADRRPVGGSARSAGGRRRDGGWPGASGRTARRARRRSPRPGLAGRRSPDGSGRRGRRRPHPSRHRCRQQRSPRSGCNMAPVQALCSIRLRLWTPECDRAGCRSLPGLGPDVPVPRESLQLWHIDAILRA